MSKIEQLRDTPPWDWPKDAGEIFRDCLNDKAAAVSERLIAAELAGDAVVIDDNLAEVLMHVVSDPDEIETVRARAVISLGPALELADTEGFDDPLDLDTVPISEEMFHKIREGLRNLYLDNTVSKEVRRRILEVSVRAPQDWHRDAVREAWSSGDRDWMLTAAFCMKSIRGFDDEILKALKNKDGEIRAEAAEAAGNWRLAAAWPMIRSILTSRTQPKNLLLAAIDAVASIKPEEARTLLEEFTTSEDEDIREAALDALAMANPENEFDDDEFDGDEFDDEDFDGEDKGRWVN